MVTISTALTASTVAVALTVPFCGAAAVGVHVSCYCVGGSAGSVLPGLAWNAAGWPGCVTLTAMVLLVVWLARGDAAASTRPV